MKWLTEYALGTDITAFSTQRDGEGFSTGNYAHFNINRYCGDEMGHIAQNRRLLCKHLGISDEQLVMPHQTHQTEVRKIDEVFFAHSIEERNALLEGVDALMTDAKGVCIGVSTADCIPILLYAPEVRAVSAIHAGWRGTVARIAEVTVRAMQTAYDARPEQMRAVIGPGISLESFEVGNEVYNAFLEARFDMPAISKKLTKWHINLFECNRLQLIASGLSPENIHIDGTCTFLHPERFFSARRLGIQSGRIFTGVMINDLYRA